MTRTCDGGDTGCGVPAVRTGALPLTLPLISITFRCVAMHPIGSAHRNTGAVQHRPAIVVDAATIVIGVVAGDLTAFEVHRPAIVVDAATLGKGEVGAYENIRATNLLVAIWFAIFSIPTFLFVKDRKPDTKALLQNVN